MCPQTMDNKYNMQNKPVMPCTFTNIKKIIQEVSGTFLYYARAVNITMLMALSTIEMKQLAQMTTTPKNTSQLLDYAMTNNKVMIMYKASNMVLSVHSNASYLNKPQARSRAEGIFFMSSNATFLTNNGTIHNTAQVIKALMSSVVESELGALYTNAKFVAPIWLTLKEMGHPQPLTPVQKGNSTTFGVIINKIIPKPQNPWI